MTLDQLRDLHKKRRKTRKKSLFGLREAEYQKHYELVRDGVKEGMALLTIVKILRDEEGAFEGKSNEAVRIAYKRALEAEGITIGRSN